jgi:hypothetical protein
MTKTGYIGLRDSANEVNVGAIQPMGDLAELAARIGMPPSINRSGNVLYWTDFSHGIGEWTTDKQGATGTILVSSGALHNRSTCMTFRSEAGATKWTWAQHFMMLVSRGGMGFEFHAGSLLATPRLEFGIYFYDGAHENQYVLRLDTSTGLLQRYDEDGALQTVETDVRDLLVYLGELRVKLVVDLDNLVLHRLYLNNTQISLVDLPCYPSATSTAFYSYVFFKSLGVTGEISGLSVSSVIVTQNEPLTPC